MVLESNTLDVLFVKDGQQGEDGKILYTWIKYAKDASGTGITDDPNGAIYIGISYNNESSIESNDPTQYAWTKIQGADGKKGEDAYTIFLENENISFATDKNRNPLSEQAYTSGITIMKGAKPVTDFTIGDIAKTQGIAVAKTDTAIAISVINGNPLPSDNGAIEIPITVGGTVFKKILSWTCSKKGDQGIQGPQGVQGEKGKDGTSVTITNKSITYQLSASGTVVPTGTWQTSPQTIPEGQYQWTKTSVTYSDGNKTESYSISYRGKNGSDGTSVKTTSTSVKYQVGDSGTTKPTGAWQNSVPTVAQGKYLWTQTIVNYSDGNSTESYSVSYKGIDGSNGSNGMNAATVYLYQRATSTPSKPSNALTYTFSTTKITGTLNNGWSTAIPTGTDAVYVTVASVSSKSDTTTIATSAWSAPVVLAQNGKSGSDGKAGLNVATIYLYQRATSKPSKPSASVTYTFNTGVASGLNNGWSQKIPDGTNPLYVTLATASSNTATDTVLSSEWSDVVVMAQNGEDGQDGTSITITSKSVTYQASSSGTTTPTGTWSTSVPTVNNGQYLWTKTTVQYSDDNKTEAYSVSYKGTNGTNGTSVTVSKTEVTYQVSTSGTTAPTGTWSTTMPTCDQGLYLWTKTYVKYSDGKDTTSYAVSYKGIDGSNFSWNLVKGTGTPKEFKPQKNINNSCVGFYKLDLSDNLPSLGDKFTISCDIEWTQFTQGTGGTFSWGFQGDTDGGWTVGNPFMAALVGVQPSKDILLSSSGSKHLSASCTIGAALVGKKVFGIGARFNYSDGTGKIKISNLKIAKEDKESPWCLHPDELEGRGVSETVQYYLATSQASGVTSSTSGWSIDITTQKLTTDKKYLWNCYQTKYSDGTSEPISTPKVIGVYGDKGQKGDNAKNLSITPSSQYFKSTDGGKTFAPNTITIKPTIQGEISFGKWQYSIDGGVSFADVVSGQKGLTISNNVLSVSKDSSLYSDAVTMVTFRAVANDSSFYDTCSIAKIYDVSDIGDGRNLWITRDDIALQACTKDKYSYTTTGTSAVCIGADASSVGTNKIALQLNNKYTISFVIAATSAVGNAQWYFCTSSGGKGVKNYGGYTIKLSTGDNIVTQTITLDTACDAAGLVIYNLPTGCIIKDIQVEKGSSPTGWTPAPEDVQTAILSTKSEISDVSLKVDNNKQAIEQRVEKTTYEQDLKLVKGDISKANEGLNKWRYEIYPKSLFASEYQGKSTMDVFAKNTNLTPSQSVLINDTDLSIAWNYDNNYIGYALTFAKFSAAKSVAITFAHDDGAHIYLNGKLIGGSDAYSQTGESLTLGFVKGWNCIEVIVNEGASTEGFKLGTTISAISECQLMNCYYGTPVARQSHITNQLVENTTNIKGISTKVSKVTSVIGENGENFTSFKNDYSDFKQTMNGFKTTVGQTYVTKDDFNGLEIGGRNLLLYSQTIRAHKDYYGVGWLTDEVETFNGCPVWSVKNQWGRLTWLFKSHVIDRGLVKVGDTLTYSLYAKTNNASGKSINCSYRFKGNTNAYWFNGSAFNVGTNWTRYSVTFTITKDMLATDTYMTEIGFEETASMSGDDKVYYACPKLERGTKATDYTPALEDNEINGQNLVSNLPSNWEQGSINYTANLAYGSLKSTLVPRLRTKDVFPVSGNITISAGTSTNSSKEELNFYYVLFDINKKSISHGDTWQSLTSPKIINCGDAKYMAIILRWGSGSTAITPSDISQICLKIERGTSATPFTLAPEDVNGKIVNVETIANQTAKKFEWIVKGGDKSSSMVLTDDFLNIVANNINLTGKVTFSWLNNETQKKITDANTWVTNNGSSTTSLNSMVKKWTDGAVSDTTQINGGWIKANTITASKIAVGDFTNYADINESNTYGFTVEKTADGVWFSKDGSKLGRDNYISKMYSCEPGQTFYVEYDISNTIKDSTEYKAAGTMLFGCDGTQTVKWYQRRGAVVGTAAGTVTHMSQQLTMPSGTRFFYVVLQIEGHPPFTGTLKIRNLSVRKAVTGAVIVDGSITADKIATDAIKSRNYISSGGTQGSFLNLSDGSFTSPNLSWDANGNLIAKNANLSGEITATKGSIGRYDITETYLMTNSGSNASGIGGNQAFWAGAEDSNSAPFRVGYDGSFVSSNADISGKITATDGTIGKYEITDTYLKTGSGSTCSGFGSDYAFWAGDDEAKYAPFRVEYDGTLNIEHIIVHGNQEDVYMKIGKDYLTIQDVNTSAHFGLDGFDFAWTNSRIKTGDQGIELYGDTPYIDFHYDNRYSDYTSRIIADSSGCLHITNSLAVDTDIHVNNGYIYNSTYGHYSWWNKSHCYISCNSANGTDNVYYYAGYHAFYVNADSKSGMMYINTNGVTSRVGFTKTSDERIKKNFESFDDNIIDAYMNIEPVKYQLKQSSNDNYHFGFKAQHIDKIFSDYGDTYNESFDICTSRPIDPDKAKELYGVDGMVEEYGLRYDELIAPTTYMVQHIYKELESTKGELTKVKQEKADLETRLQAIEAKLGL